MDFPCTSTVAKDKKEKKKEKKEKKVATKKVTIKKGTVQQEPVVEEAPTMEYAPVVEEAIVVEATPAVVEEPLAESLSSSHPTPEQLKASPYTSSPVALHIGARRVVYYVPRSLLHSAPQIETKINPGGEIALSDVDVDIGHTLVHYLHTGTYQALNTETSSPMMEVRIGFKRALLTYIMTITYDLADLQRLAIHESEEHGAKMGIFEILETINEDFAKLGQTSWFHDYLHKKARAAFEEDHTVFTNSSFLECLDNVALVKIMLRCVVELYNERVSGMITVEEAVPEQSVSVQEDCMNPLSDEVTVDESSHQEAFEQCDVTPKELCALDYPDLEAPVNRCSDEVMLDAAIPDEVMPVEECSTLDYSFPECPCDEPQSAIDDVGTEEPVAVDESIQAIIIDSVSEPTDISLNSWDSIWGSNHSRRATECAVEVAESPLPAELECEPDCDPCPSSIEKACMELEEECITAAADEEISYEPECEPAREPEVERWVDFEQVIDPGCSKEVEIPITIGHSDTESGPDRPVEANDGQCLLRAKHLLEGDMWKNCKQCRAVVRRVAVELVRAESDVERLSARLDEVLVAE